MRAMNRQELQICTDMERAESELADEVPGSPEIAFLVLVQALLASACCILHPRVELCDGFALRFLSFSPPKSDCRSSMLVWARACLRSTGTSGIVG